MKKSVIHFVGIGGIGISAIARWHLRRGYSISWSDLNANTVTEALWKEWITIHIWESSEHVPKNCEKVIYSEAVATKPDVPVHEQVRNNSELLFALENDIEIMSYPEALGSIIAKGQQSICIAGTHGKSTTTSMLWRVMHQWKHDATVITGTLLKEFQNTNLYDTGEDIVIAESCEYKHAFHHYRPTIWVILNVEHDHHDCYPTWESYLQSFVKFATHCEQILVIDGEKGIDELISGVRCLESEKHESSITTIHRINVIENNVTTHSLQPNGDYKKASCESLPIIQPSIPGEHMHKDSLCAYVAATLVWVNPHEARHAIESYAWAWRRMELVWETQHGQLMYSDYGHTPSEITPTLASLRAMHPEKELICVFQPHQYARTIALLEEFMTCFWEVDTVIIPNIYFSRDSQADVDHMPAEKFVQHLSKYHKNVVYGEGLKNTQALLSTMTNENSIILLLGAGDVDDLRDKI